TIAEIESLGHFAPKLSHQQRTSQSTCHLKCGCHRLDGKAPPPCSDGCDRGSSRTYDVNRDNCVFRVVTVDAAGKTVNHDTWHDTPSLLPEVAVAIRRGLSFSF